MNEELLPRAVARMNGGPLPNRLAVFDNDPLPTNQRNLTDVRTRLGNLLEWELGLALAEEVAPHVGAELRLAYVIANRFPDFEFRGPDGGRGIRLEAKAVDVTAEEKAANFDTLLKDIRAGSDFVVTMIWRLHRPDGANFRFPYVETAIALDAEHLAKMRDTYWLHTPPGNVGAARQGFDLRFAVNCSGDAFNKEEGNFGKLMRLFDPRLRPALPEEVRTAPTFDMYYRLRERIVREGLREIAGRLGAAFSGQQEELAFTGTALRAVYHRDGRSLVVLGDSVRPTMASVNAAARSVRRCAAVLTLNEKFQWSAYRDDGVRLAANAKPESAEEWLRSI